MLILISHMVTQFLFGSFFDKYLSPLKCLELIEYAVCDALTNLTIKPSWITLQLTPLKGLRNWLRDLRDNEVCEIIQIMIGVNEDVFNMKLKDINYD